MSDEENSGKALSRRDTFKLATAVSALGVGLCATLHPSEAQGESAGSIHQLKLDGLKLDALVLSIHKDDANSPPLHSVNITPLITSNLKLAPGAYFLKLTALKGEKPVQVAVDQFNLKI